MKRLVLVFGLVLAMLMGCSGGGGGGLPGEQGGDTRLVGTWDFDAGIHPIRYVTFRSGGSATVVFVNGCRVDATWATQSGTLYMEVDDQTSLCASYDLDDRWEFGYSINNGGRELVIADDTGTTWLVKR